MPVGVTAFERVAVPGPCELIAWMSNRYEVPLQTQTVIERLEPLTVMFCPPVTATAL